MKIKHIKMQTGERLPMLLLDNGVPVFWVTLFVGKMLRAQAQNTIEHALTTLRHFRSWEDYHERDLSAEFRSGRFLTDGDVQSIADHCAYQVEAFEKWAARTKRGGNVSVANLLAMKAPSPLKTVQFDTQYNRLTTIANYLSFVAETVCRVRSDKRDTQIQIEQMKKELLGKRPKSDASKRLGRYVHIPAAAYLRCKNIAHPDHVDNPFRQGKSGEVRRRNHLMVEIAYQLGLRGGEILGLWVEDIEFGPRPTLSVRRRHNNPLDPRKHQAVAKTMERVLPLPPELASSLNDYILSDRSHHPYANSHPILFVTSQAPWKGHPLSYTSFGEVFKSIKKVDPDQLEDISPHALRHDRACRFVDELQLTNQAAKTNKLITAITDGEFERALMNYFGWTNPKSAAVYLGRRTRERVDEAMETFRNSAFGK